MNKTEPTGDKFQEWWRERYFHTTKPLYSIFKELAELQADVAYIDFLCQTLERGDKLSAAAHERKRDTKSLSDSKAIGAEVQNLLERFGLWAIDITARRLQDLYFKDGSDFPQLTERDRGFILLQTVKAGAQYQRDTRLLEYDAVTRNFMDQAVRDPILWLCRDCYSRPMPGRQPDMWGTLFLTAVTEHTIACNSGPCYAQAGKLLFKVRSPSKDSPPRKSLATSTTQRISKFKDAYTDWPGALDLLQSQFSKTPQLTT